MKVHLMSGIDISVKLTLISQITIYKENFNKSSETPCALWNWMNIMQNIQDPHGRLVTDDQLCYVTQRQSYIWPLARPATPEETITVELRSQTTKILLKTGLTSPSSSRGAISSSSKLIGRYVLLMQGELYLSPRSLSDSIRWGKLWVNKK